MDARTRSFAVYGVSATVTRSADAGAIVGFVLLDASSRDTAAFAGLLAAALTAPHLAGPFVAPALSCARQPLVLVVVALILYG